jgi:adenine-specific DNA-methyltransferase
MSAVALPPDAEDPAYLSRQLITYLGNKRALLDPINHAVAQVRQRLGGRPLRIFDAFSGSGVVARRLKAHASLLISNDLEAYAAVVGRCFLRNRSTVEHAALQEAIDAMNAQVAAGQLLPGFIRELYAPNDAAQIQAGERVFYTPENAQRLDTFRQMIAQTPAAWHDLLLGPLLSAASIHANTAGVFKGFYKNRQTGIGQFGGSGADALQRICGPVRLAPPVLSRFECETHVLHGDTNQVAAQLRNLDLAYLDPPYNQHPYGANYFMLNLLVDYQRPAQISPVAGIPPNWQRSGYNVRSQALPLLRSLIAQLDAPFVLISFNNEGFIAPETMDALLREFGQVERVEMRYNAFRGSRNLARRAIHVTEQLFLLERRR